MTCPFCGGKGLIRVAYRSGEPFDIAICDCRDGMPWRRVAASDVGDTLLRQRLDLTPEQQVAYRECFDGETPLRREEPNYLVAAKTRKAKL